MGLKKIKRNLKKLWFKLQWQYVSTSEENFMGWVTDTYRHRIFRKRYLHTSRPVPPRHPMCRCSVVPVVLPEPILKNLSA